MGDSLPSGNVLVGWSSFLPKSSSLVDEKLLDLISEAKVKNEGSSSPGKKKKQGPKVDQNTSKKPPLQDRIFSLSSITSPVYTEIDNLVNEKSRDANFEGKENETTNGDNKDVTDKRDVSTVASARPKKAE